MRNDMVGHTGRGDEVTVEGGRLTGNEGGSKAKEGDQDVETRTWMSERV